MSIIRTLSKGRSRLHLFGVEGYASTRGADELFALIDTQRPTMMLMESFAVSSSKIVVGGVLPYRNHLDPVGLEKALHLVTDHAFRASLTSEAVGVLAGLRAGTEIRFADRQHPLSFSRLIARLSVNEMRHAIIVATEAFAASLETQGRTQDALPLPPQNVLCQFFPELWGERHAVMAHVVRQALGEADGDVALVVGKEHIDPVVEKLNSTDDDDIAALLREPSETTDRDEELEKRAALAALLVSTQTFPAEYVLPPVDEIDADAKTVVSRVYPKYRWAIDGRLNSVRNGRSSYDHLADAVRQGQTARGLGHLEDLCKSLASE
eukprot:TRINITY_DN57951_c0_g1_i1.p1 TRINITY_DN57951_c0_g1~~TRINITY_DN57951_c0_g1_i1.p1  ORF type:complete len:323 (-),score=43.20 TRINITY_DN57951_c0_g1_i1:200-1168(-)